MRGRTFPFWGGTLIRWVGAFVSRSIKMPPWELAALGRWVGNSDGRVAESVRVALSGEIGRWDVTPFKFVNHTKTSMDRLAIFPQNARKNVSARN